MTVRRVPHVLLGGTRQRPLHTLRLTFRESSLAKNPPSAHKFLAACLPDTQPIRAVASVQSGLEALIYKKEAAGDASSACRRISY